ncbi:hypothetical protein C7999DRAFT_32743 [Corynascus novoguineensis]|uniref:Uncharacterized protein n=1 Tax=Corynascus novoguineensis TaxID=1126955 RepID=A0AAN7CRA1_9PEZI|nr:hypothetical protein C7999DRAFT_32743 [Corynascus novoguineensis]
MEEDIQERKRLQIPVPKYDALSSGEATPDFDSVPSDSYLDAWHSRVKNGALKPKEPEVQETAENKSTEGKHGVVDTEYMGDKEDNMKKGTDGDQKIGEIKRGQ